jgi:phosphate transport system substrate-binding protein
MNTKYVLAAIVAIAIIIGSIGAYIYLSNPGTEAPTVTINGSGATFPYPLLNNIINLYNSTKNVQINYQPIGSGGGISDLKNKNNDFAGSDAPLSATERTAAPNTVHIPETIGAVTIAYNLQGIPTGLKLTGQVIADIFQGTITKWNDPAIQNLNPDITLPAQTITTVHRSDGSGTTFIFTSYLSKVSTAWNTSVGSGKSVSWPAGGLGSSGNTGVAASVNSTTGSIGYVELAYALTNGMTVAAVQNPSGHYILPTLQSTTAAAQSGAASLPAGNASWTDVSILNSPNAEAYPIVSFSYIIVYKELSDIPSMTEQKATAIVQFLWYIVHDGQQLAPGLEYAPLPSNVVQINEATIRSITFNGHTLPTT